MFKKALLRSDYDSYCNSLLIFLYLVVDIKTTGLYIIVIDYKTTSLKDKLGEDNYEICITAATGHFGQVAVKELVGLVGADNVVAIARNLEKLSNYFLMILKFVKVIMMIRIV